VTTDLLPSFGKYTDVQRLGEGGFGEVYRAVDTTLNRPVALKVPHRELLRDPAFAAQFRQEAQIAAQLDHPNIVRIYSVGDYEGTPFIEMELVEGQTLADHIKQKGRLTPEEALAIIEPVCAALAEAHGKGIIHRDIKPGNILIRQRDGRVLVSDFGLAKTRENSFQASLSSSNIVVGTFRYMPPEQANPKLGPVGPQSDIYSPGVVLYEMLTGRVPFDGKSVGQLIYQHTIEEPELPSNININLSRAVESVVLKALQKKPEDRYVSAQAMALALRAAVERGTIQPGVYPEKPLSRQPPEPVATSDRRRPGWIIIIPAIIGMVGLIAVAVVISSVSRLRGRTEVVPTEIVRIVTATPAPAIAALTPTPVPTEAPSTTPTMTRTPSATPSPTKTPSTTPTMTRTPSATPSPTATDTATAPPTSTPTSTLVPSSTPVPTRASGTAPMPTRANLSAMAISPDNVGRLVQLAHVEKMYDGWGPMPYSPDGQLLAASDSGIRLLDSHSLTELRFWATAGRVWCVAFSPDGVTLGTGEMDGTVRLYRVADGTLLRIIQVGGRTPCDLAFSPDGAMLASGSDDNSVRVWRTSDGALLHRMMGHTNSVDSVAFSPDGRIVASGSDDNTIRLWGAADGALIRTLQGHTERVTGLAFSPDGATLGSGSYDHSVRLWRVADGALIRTLQVDTVIFERVAFSPDGTVLASGGAKESGGGIVRLWRVADGAVLRTLESGAVGQVIGVAFSPDGASLVSYGYGGVWLWGVK
jgi:WD40 repeat protein/predicted Ser/Thr protein kinase